MKIIVFNVTFKCLSEKMLLLDIHSIADSIYISYECKQCKHKKLVMSHNNLPRLLH